MKHNKNTVSSDEIYQLQNKENMLILNKTNINEAYINFFIQGFKNIFYKENYPYKLNPLKSIQNIDDENERK